MGAEGSREVAHALDPSECSDASAPVSRNALFNLCRVGFASPLRTLTGLQKLLVSTAIKTIDNRRE